MATERVFVYQHKGFDVTATVWNAESAPDPEVLFDFNNVLNAYSMNELQRVAKVVGKPYAIVSLLMSQGKNFQDLKRRASETKECIIALTTKLKKNRQEVETGLKFRIIELMRWRRVSVAIDDKPHEWFNPVRKNVIRELPLDPKKEPVFMVIIN